MARSFFRLASPSVALNAPNVQHPIQMSYTHTISWSASAHDIIKQKVKSTARHLVFNCHGFAWRPTFQAPHLSLGTVFHPGNVSAFDPIRQMQGLFVIWLSACNLGSAEAGRNFMQSIARHAYAYVVGASMPVGDISCPRYCVEDWTGSMPMYVEPTGRLMTRTEFLQLKTTLGIS
jgi:hypothetical protein